MQNMYNSMECFQRIVALLYREIGILKQKNHSVIAAKAPLSAPFFRNRKEEAKRLYKEMRDEKRPQVILAAYESLTGLTLADIHEAFDRGNWEAPSGKIEFGGPKWAAVAKFTLDLQGAIESQNHQVQESLIAKLGTLQHNNGRIIDKFSQLD